MKQVVLHEKAAAEIRAAALKYEGQREGLGEAFVAAVEESLLQVAKRPQAFGFYRKTVFRKRMVKKFPYLVIYREREESVWIVAVAHAKRKPGYWMERTKDP